MQAEWTLVELFQDPNIILLAAVLGVAQSYDAPGSDATRDAAYGLALAAGAAIVVAVVTGDPNLEGAVRLCARRGKNVVRAVGQGAE